MSVEVAVSRRTYAGLFMVTLGTLAYEILLTRIFSVTMWYHYAFMAISVAMFGMTVGAVLVYLVPRLFSREGAPYHMALSAFLFALSMVFSFLSHLSIPFIPLVPRPTLVAVWTLALTYIVIAVPFVFSGICVCLALTKFPREVSKLYAADLAGAAAGCIVVIHALRMTDGPTAVMLVALLVTAGSVFFLADVGRTRLRALAVVSGLALAVFVAGNTVLAKQQRSMLSLQWIKGILHERPLYEKWNSFSRIAIEGEPEKLRPPRGWGLSANYPLDRRVRELRLSIDARACTLLTGFDGDLSGVDHLRYDLVNIAHYLRPEGSVFVVGSGGGRDILSALTFDQKKVVAIEMNEDIVEAANGEFGDFTGHLDRDPRVVLVCDEARSYLARQKERYDIVQISLIDTWAATAAGAFVLSENSLYTVEAWRTFLDRLSPGGILSVSRWYFNKGPAEIYRLAALARVALEEAGAENPRDHIIVLRNRFKPGGIRRKEKSPGTVLVSRRPFSEEDVGQVEQIATKMRFDVMLSPRAAREAVLAEIIEARDLESYLGALPIKVNPPTDDSPFFFHVLRFRDVLNPGRAIRGGWIQSFHLAAVLTLSVLLMVVVVLTLLCIIAPLLLTTDRAVLRGSFPFGVFFAGIGLGFMLVEISQLQRLVVFLGHPTYALSVVLFSLLVSSGLGSYTTQKVEVAGSGNRALGRLLLLLVVLVLFGVLTPVVVAGLQSAHTPVRILAATAMLFPLGLFMGMAFPLGMKLAAARSEALTPWLWGVNGASSICASVAATAIALHSGISSAFWTGAAAYLVALVAFASATRAGRWAAREADLTGRRACPRRPRQGR